MARRWLAGILTASFALRLCLGAGGGQDFWPDESRYGSAVVAALNLSHGRFRDALEALFGHADHVLFRPAALPAALLSAWTGGSHPELVWGYFALFSVGTIFLIWAIALRAGASEDEALWAAFLAAASGSLFIYSRFYLPYDIALFELMAALWVALGRGTPANAVLTGAVAALGFLTYNGYWLLCGTVLVLYTALGDGGPRKAVMRGGFAALGLALTLSLVIAAGVALSGGVLPAYAALAGSVRQGDFRIGHRVIAEYLWFTERGLALVLLAALAFAVAAGQPSLRASRLRWWIGGLAMILGGLVFFSDVVPVFMVYGRLTRAAVPFACLAAARGIALFLDRRRFRGWWAAGLAVLVALLAALNFAAPLRQVFPSDFSLLAAREMRRDAGGAYSFYLVLFAEPLWGRPLHYDLPPHTDLLVRANPMAYRPYQYEGYSAAQREDLNRFDVSMRLIRFDARLPAQGRDLDGYPGPVRMMVRFRPDEARGAEPLVVCGSKEAADLVFISYLDSKHVAFGLDHQGAPRLVSAPMDVDFSRPHELVISTGSMLPPPGSAFYGAMPGLQGLRERLIVEMDGQVALSARADFHASTPGDIVFGANFVGSPTTVTHFSGMVSAFSGASVDGIAAMVPSAAVPKLARDRPAEWAGALGPLRLQFRLPAAGPGTFASQPLLAIAGPGSSDMLYVEQGEGGRFRVGYDSRGRGPLLSGPMSPSPRGWEVMDVCIGSLLPARGAPVFARAEGFGRMRGQIDIRVNGEQALLAEREFEPAGAKGVALGENTVACSLCCAHFQGDMAPVRALGPENLPAFGTRLAEMLDNPDGAWDGHTGPVLLKVRFPTGLSGTTEPLLVSGVAGAGDALSVRYDDDSHLCFLFEHARGDRVASQSVTVRPGEVNEVLLSTGALMPPEGARLYQDSPDLLRLRGLAEVAVNGRPVLVAWQAPHPAEAARVELGANSIGVGASGARFHGTIDALRIARPADAFEQGGLEPRLARPGWEGYPGPLRLRLSVSDEQPGRGRPIVTTGFPGGGDFIFLEFGSDGLARIVLDHWGSPLVRSEGFTLLPGAAHELILSFGALFPPPGCALYVREPDLLRLRSQLVVLMDGRRVLASAEPCHPTPAARIILGANLIGGTSTGTVFTGSIGEVEPAPLDAVRP
jgi:hypothetical protein